MYILDKRVDNLSFEDIERLVINKVKETKTLDYKRDFSLAKDSDKKEFVNDITAFYNTDGGCIIYGIEERKDAKNQNTGIPENICGITIDNEDKLIQCIEDTIRSNTDPSIANLLIKILKINGCNDSVIIIGVPKGLWLPSMVTINDLNRFYKRRNTGKYLVDVYELNDMFMQNQVLKEKAESYKNERIQKLLQKEIFPSINTDRFCMVHIIPYSFLNEKSIDISPAHDMNIGTLMMPLGSRSGCTLIYNIDGYASHGANDLSAYNQIIRNGAFEIFSTQLFFENPNNNNAICISGQHMYRSIIESITKSLQVLTKFSVEPPFLISIYFHNIKDVSFIIENSYMYRKFQYANISLPMTILPAFDSDLKETLKPLFDILWQCVSYQGCPYN